MKQQTLFELPEAAQAAAALDLPDSLTDLLESGLPGPLVEALVRSFGGYELSVPHTMSAGHRIEKALGAQWARQLSTLCGGQRLNVPRGASQIRRARDLAIRRDYDSLSREAEAARRAGEKGPEVMLTLCRTYQLTERQIRTVLGRG